MQKIIFCQAPADLFYVLNILQLPETEESIIYVINIKSNYLFLCSLDLPNCKILFLEQPKVNFKNPISLLKGKLRLVKIKKELFDKKKGVEVYFFSIYFDWFTASIVTFLSSNNNIIYYNHHDELINTKSDRRFYPNIFILSFLYSFLTNTNFYHSCKSPFLKFKVIDYPISAYNPTKNSLKIDNKYIFNVQNKDKKVILFFISQEEIDFLRESIEDIKDLILDIKKVGVLIYCKGHPRLGIPQSIVELCDDTVPNFVPAEFINYDCILACIGLISTALAYPSKRYNLPVFSIMNFLNFKDEKRKIGFSDYLREISDDKIIFPVNKSLLKNHLLKITENENRFN